MKKILLAAIFCAIFLVSDGISQNCGRGQLRVKFAFDKTANPPTEVKYQLYFVLPKNKAKVRDKEMFDFAARFYYGKPEKYPGYFWKKYDEQDFFLRVPKAKAEKYIKNYKTGDYQKLAAKFEEDFIKQLSGQSQYGEIVFKTFELEDMPLLMKAEADGFKTVYLLSNFWGGCFSSGTVHMKSLKPITKNNKP